MRDVCGILNVHSRRPAAMGLFPLVALTVAIVLAACLVSPLAIAQEAPPDTLSTGLLKNRSLEELMEMDITTISKRAEPLLTSAAAIHVISREEIRRSGATTLPEALRLAPNLEVAQIDARQWAISARGFNSTAANKLLVMIDGRVVYTPLYSGVFWDVQNVFLEDVDRIEVTSGPGGTLWGSNAVNGIINVITSNARDSASQGALAFGGGGSRERGFGGVRYGGSPDEHLALRGYAMYFDKNDTQLPNGDDAGDRWRDGQAGFRADWNGAESDEVSLQGDLYGGTGNQLHAGDATLAGENVLGHWSHAFSDASNLEVRSYADRTHRELPGTFAENLVTLDIDLQHRFPLGERNDFLWGAGFRYSDDDLTNTPVLAFLPAHLATRLSNAFLQDEITLVPDRVRLSLGSKYEHNDFSGSEFQPGMRLSWLVSDGDVLWGAVSRAVRTPSRIDRDFYVPGSPPYLLVGGANFTSEKLIAYELGYRTSAQRFTLDVAAYYNSYDDIRSVEPGPQFMIENGLEGSSYGCEVEAKVQVTERWRLSTGYQYLQKNITLKPGSHDVSNGQGEGNDPKHTLSVHSLLDLSDDLEFDIYFRAVDALPNTATPVPGYAAGDVRLAWRPVRHCTLAVVGQRLLGGRHPEFGAPATRSEIQPGVYGSFELNF